MNNWRDICLEQFLESKLFYTKKISFKPFVSKWVYYTKWLYTENSLHDNVMHGR